MYGHPFALWGFQVDMDIIIFPTFNVPPCHPQFVGSILFIEENHLDECDRSGKPLARFFEAACSRLRFNRGHEAWDSKG
ncbi:hypothetical protein M404DRAFT_871078 [Pisolithus tinctorius Marx 270]|uniref:Uncharacterized protein n=1 Tax=Pisolithus tinctorius Marx 270 TaxID=870435 RepID=A0A0C3PQ64_PISTI|nr:hypothetical protein M404DRAFT_871078 [Pisolithus tinctorius Marx 270]